MVRGREETQNRLAAEAGIDDDTGIDCATRTNGNQNAFIAPAALARKEELNCTYLSILRTEPFSFPFLQSEHIIVELRRNCLGHENGVRDHVPFTARAISNNNRNRFVAKRRADCRSERLEANGSVY